MLWHKVFSALVAAGLVVLVSWPVPAETGGADSRGRPVAVADAEPEEDLSPAKIRARERRRERLRAKRWITVPHLMPADALSLVDRSEVAVIDVTCSDRGGEVEERLPGASWQDWTTVESWAHRYEWAETIVVYCA